MVSISPYIFREYDIRGRITEQDELSEKNQYILGRATGTFFRARAIADITLGYDARAYSPEVSERIVKGLRDSGVSVVDIGQVLVPNFYFSQYLLKKRGGVMVTASHNPNGWSGMKIANDYSTTLLGDEIKELYGIAVSGKFAAGQGKYEKISGVIEAYTKDVLSRVKISRHMKVLVDAGNGTAGPIVPPILRAAGCEVFEQHCNIDPAFPNHEPNPSTLEAAEDIARGAKQFGADVGFGFDDDGDRLGFGTETGEIVWPDKALAFLARPILAKEPGAMIVFDVKCTQALIDDILAHGGKPVMWRTGHSYIKRKAKELDAPMGGERSGHFFFRRDYYGYDDAIFSALKFLEFLAEQDKPFSKLLNELPTYVTSPVWEPECADDKKYQVVEKLTEQLKKEFGAGNVVDINGARVQFEDGWGLVRASSNLPRLVIVFEAKTGEGAKRIEQIFREKLAQFPEVGKEWHSG